HYRDLIRSGRAQAVRCVEQVGSTRGLALGCQIFGVDMAFDGTAFVPGIAPVAGACRMLFTPTALYSPGAASRSARRVTGCPTIGVPRRGSTESPDAFYRRFVRRRRSFC